MARSEAPKPLTRAKLELAVRDLQARVEGLEQERAASSHPQRRAGPELGLIDSLSELTEPPTDPGAPAGTVTYAGVAELSGEGLGWQMLHSVPDLLALDEGRIARQLAAMASPVRLSILRELAAGPLQTHELQSRLDEPSAGQLYHHLRELLATGLVTQPRRSVYEVPDRAVIPLLTLLACAHDLAGGTPDDARETQ
jgi:DNA-binding transcriptional ArsR family regulator